MKLIKLLPAILAITLLNVTIGSTNVAAEVAVIVHPSNANVLNKKHIKRLYLGKRKTFPDDSRVTPLDQQEGSLIREIFIAQILGMNSNQVRMYWAQQMFTGQGMPPKIEEDDLAVKKAVMADPTAIGYIDAANVDESIKVVFTF